MAMSDNWVIEAANGYGQCIEVKEKLFETRSAFQKIEVYETVKLGRLLLLDGIIQLTSYDEFAYQEMMAHLPCYTHGSPRNVLVIGGGDGGVLRELAKHPGIEKLDICEIDAAVIDAAKRFLPELACGYDDPRVTVHIADGSKFIRERKGVYDVIVVDSTDPGGPAAPLFGKEFYAALKRALRPGGIIASQAESPWLLPEVVKQLFDAAKSNFSGVDYAAISVPTYPTGMIGVCVAGDRENIAVPMAAPDSRMAGKLRYYNTDIHRAAFAKPEFVRELLNTK